MLPVRGRGLPRVRERLDRAPRGRDGAPAGPRELRLRQRALHGVRLRRRHRADRAAPVRDPRHAAARSTATSGSSRSGTPRREGAARVAAGVRADRPARRRARRTHDPPRGEGRGHPRAVGGPGRGRSPCACWRCATIRTRRRSAWRGSTTGTETWSSSWACGTWRRATSSRGRLRAHGCRGSTSRSRPRHIRGVVSNGMLCSPSELAISQDHTGILVLDDTWAPGTDVKGALGLDDPVLDIEVEPNRPDFLSDLRRGPRGGRAHRRAPRAPRPLPGRGARPGGRGGDDPDRRAGRLPPVPGAGDPRRPPRPPRRSWPRRA